MQGDRKGQHHSGEASTPLFSATAGSSSNFPSDPSRSPSYRHKPLQAHPSSYPNLSASYASGSAEGYYPPSGPGGTLSSQNAYGASALAPPGKGQSNLLGKNVNNVWDETLHRAVAASSSSGPRRLPQDDQYPIAVDNNSARYGQSLSPIIPRDGRPGSASRYLQPSPSFSSPQYTSQASDPSNPLDQVLPRGLLLHIIDLYFDYIYALIPAIHRPTFMRDLTDRREERDGQEEWTVMVLILVCSTLLQVPRAFVPLPRRDVKAVAERCWELTRAFMIKDWAEVSLERCKFSFLSSGIPKSGLS